jgi:hypothetical protein
MQSSIRERDAFNGRDSFAVHFHAQHQTRIHQHAVEDDAARAAVAVVAAFLCACQIQNIAQHFEQTLARLTQKFHALSIYFGLNLCLHMNLIYLSEVFIKALSV